MSFCKYIYMLLVFNIEKYWNLSKLLEIIVHIEIYVGLLFVIFDLTLIWKLAYYKKLYLEQCHV